MHNAFRIRVPEHGRGFFISRCMSIEYKKTKAGTGSVSEAALQIVMETISMSEKVAVFSCTLPGWIGSRIEIRIASRGS
jgi:hypothetical protein